MSETRHLHRDYWTTFCGLDASHIPMTYEPGEHDCEACAKAHAEHLAAEKAAAEEAEAEDKRRRDAEAKAQADRAQAEADELAALGLKFTSRKRREAPPAGDPVN